MTILLVSNSIIKSGYVFVMELKMGMKLHIGDSILIHLEKIRILDFTIK